jgi:signal transduction histidine kinase
MLNLMLDGYLGTLPEKLEPYLRRVSRNCEELQDMVKNYLDLSRVERGELVAHMDEADCLRDVVEPCVEQLQPLFRSRNVELCVDCSAAIDMRVDAGLVRVALSNYLSNAAKYGKEGGRAHLTVAATDDRVEFEVWNEGAGFSEEEAKQLFQQFSRLKNENTRTKKGSGVGLFLCKHIAEVHGGGVAADSEPGQWARFTLSLPRYVEAPRRQPEAPLEMAASGGEP